MFTQDREHQQENTGTLKLFKVFNRKIHFFTFQYLQYKYTLKSTISKNQSSLTLFEEKFNQSSHISQHLQGIDSFFSFQRARRKLLPPPPTMPKEIDLSGRFNTSLLGEPWVLAHPGDDDSDG